VGVWVDADRRMDGMETFHRMTLGRIIGGPGYSVERAAKDLDGRINGISLFLRGASLPLIFVAAY